MHNLQLGVPAVPPGMGDTRPSPPGTVRGPLPPVPNSLAQLRMAGNEQRIGEDIYGGEYGGHG